MIASQGPSEVMPDGAGEAGAPVAGAAADTPRPAGGSRQKALLSGGTAAAPFEPSGLLALAGTVVAITQDESSFLLSAGREFGLVTVEFDAATASDPTWAAHRATVGFLPRLAELRVGDVVSVASARPLEEGRFRAPWVLVAARDGAPSFAASVEPARLYTLSGVVLSVDRAAGSLTLIGALQFGIVRVDFDEATANDPRMEGHRQSVGFARSLDEVQEGALVAVAAARAIGPGRFAAPWIKVMAERRLPYLDPIE